MIGVLIGQINFILIYSVIVFGRGMLLSVPAAGLVLLLRKTLFRRNVFAKGLFWSLLLLVPFMGKLKFFYESRAGIRLFYWWHAFCAGNHWFCWLYTLAALLLAGYFCFRKHRLKRMVKKMSQKERLFGMEIRTCGLTVTPFAVGLCRPVIVIPEVFLKEYGKDELETILLHEKTHIRLGHLWCYFLWDCLRVMFWMNPLMSVCTRLLRADLEDICDCVCIQKQRGEAVDYGMLILKTAGCLSGKNDPCSVGTDIPAFAGEREFGEMKHRMQKIAGYTPYRKERLAALALLFAALFLAAWYGILKASYSRYIRLDEVSIYTAETDPKMLLFSDRKTFGEAFWYEDGTLFIDWNEMEPLLQENGIKEDCFFLGFGGFMKLPGIGGGCNVVYVDRAEPKPADGIEAIDCPDVEEQLIVRICKYLY